MKFTMKNSQSGFSLVELMTVVAIIGVLAAIAVPRLTTYRAKAVQSEAKTNLGHLTTMQRSFQIEAGAYAADIGALGYIQPTMAPSISGVGARYVYTTVATGLSTGTSPATGGSVAAGWPICGGAGNTAADTWTHSAVTGELRNTVPFRGCL